MLNNIVLKSNIEIPNGLTIPINRTHAVETYDKMDINILTGVSGKSGPDINNTGLLTLSGCNLTLDQLN